MNRLNQLLLIKKKTKKYQRYSLKLSIELFKIRNEVGVSSTIKIVLKNTVQTYDSDNNDCISYFRKSICFLYSDGMLESFHERLIKVNSNIIILLSWVLLEKSVIDFYKDDWETRHTVVLLML